MFHIFKKLKGKQQAHPTNSISTELLHAHKKIAEARLEYSLVLEQTATPPVGDIKKAWNWAVEKIAYFREANLPENDIRMILTNVVLYLTEYYEQHLDEFLKVSRSCHPISCAIMLLLMQNKKEIEKHNQETANEKLLLAKRIAEPYFQYLEKNTDKYCKGQHYFNSDEEVMMYAMLQKHKEENDIRADDNYTFFWIQYSKLLECSLTKREDYEAYWQERNRLMQLAIQLSPCSSSAWCELARINLSKDELFIDYINHALYFALDKYNLAECYDTLVMYYALRDPETAKAFYALACEIIDSSIYSKRLLEMHCGGTNFDGDYKEYLSKKGINLGFSRLALEAKKLVQEM